MSAESDQPPAPSQPPLLPPRRIAFLAAAAVVAYLLDLLTKTLVVANLEGHPPVRLFGGALYLTVIRNGGAAFSIATSFTWVLALVKLAVVIGIIWFAPRVRSTGWAIGLGLVMAGALGNITDRIFRAPGPLRGHVVDFLSLFSPNGTGFAIFNIADCAVSVGGALIVVLVLLGKNYDGTSVRETKAAPTRPPH